MSLGDPVFILGLHMCEMINKHITSYLFWRVMTMCIRKTYNFFSSFLICVSLLSQPHFEGSVRSPLTLPKMGVWSPSGLPKTQKTIVGVKTPSIEVLFIPLERSWSVDVQNGLAWAIWTSAAQVMGKRRARSQTSSLTPDH
jgi:hypothetical protein